MSNKYSTVTSNYAGVSFGTDIRSQQTPTGTNHTFSKDPLGDNGRIVFIESLPGTFSFYTSHKGSSMFSSGMSFPELRKADNIVGNRRWVLGLSKGLLDPPTKSSFYVEYIHCPKERRSVDVNELEAWQRIGKTTLSDEEIRAKANALWGDWGQYDQRLWNSQNFCICLAVLILTPNSLGANLTMLRAMNAILWNKQNEMMGNIVLRRHFTCMGGMVVGGLLTGGIGAFGSWLYAGYGIVEAPSALQARTRLVRNLVQRFSELNALWQGNS